MTCVYKITSPSGKIYIGSTINFKSRISHYISLDCKPQRKLYNSFVKYGYFNHKVEVLQECTLEEMYPLERYYGDLYNVLGKGGLNLSLPGYGEIKNATSAETRALRAILFKKEGNPFFGKTHTVEARQKIRDAKKNLTQEQRDRIRAAQIGKKMSDTAKSNMRKSQLGRTHPPEVIEKMKLSAARANVVLCTQTGIFYHGVSEAAFVLNMNYRTLQNQLRGYKKNRTRMIYV